MKQMFLVLSVLLLGLTWAVAQDSTTQSSPSSASQSSAGSDSSGMASSTPTQAGSNGQVTVEGCLSGSSGNYTLSDKNGVTYQLTGDTAKLSEHVGHEVKITGMSGSGAASGGENASGASSGANAGQSLQVSSVKHVSKTCKSSGMAH
jgi:hypothetical protein